jgi:hypothetical protein
MATAKVGTKAMAGPYDMSAVLRNTENIFEELRNKYGLRNTADYYTLI